MTRNNNSSYQKVMKQKSKLILWIIILFSILGLVAVGIQIQSSSISKTSKTVPSEQEPHEKQLAYVKEHQQDIVDLVKKSNSKVESVQIDWSQTR